MASPGEASVNETHVGKKKKLPARYWQELQEEERKDENKVKKDGEQSKEALQQEEDKTQKAKKRKQDQSPSDGEKVKPEKSDPFPGPAPIPEDRLQKFKRKDKLKKPHRKQHKLRDIIARSEDASEMAQKQAARFDLLLPEEAGFLEGDEDEDTCMISQEDIAEAVDITSGAKYFNLKLSQFGPYRLDYSKTGRHLLLGGRRGHVACIDWASKQLMCEINVMESVNDVKWLHTEAMYAVAQKKWLYIYDSNGIELHCIRKFNDVLRMQFLPYHFLLATAVSSQYMVTSGMDKKLKVYDVRTFKPLKSYFLPAGAACLSLSQKGLLSAATGDVVQVYKDVCSMPVTKPYMAHRLRGTVWGLHFCPFEDVLGIGHGDGFTSMLVPGAGEPNFDGLDANPYRSAKQRQEWEVKALMEKIQPDLISLDPTELAQVDQATWEQRHQDRVEVLGFDPLAKEKFVPKYKKKGRSSAGAIERRKKQVAHEEQRDVIRKSVEDKMKMEKERKERERKKAALSTQKSALDRFKK
ncbi:WD repeat-containing protein 46 [Neolamprologus brichardi]|uniref:WD repeat-containing protein 46 n=1 Tax=Neolamprologus brichardi TaxID=32507 RepID=UPI0003EBD213|nr:WD repeat-containing protein 46 [Neolamprologus brichardi]